MQLRKLQKDKAPVLIGNTPDEKIAYAYKIIEQLWSRVVKLEFDLKQLKEEQ